MLQDEVLALLKEQDAPCSGQAMSQRLGVSRAAVWKAVESLRQSGYTISSATNRGYCLESSPDRLSAGELTGMLSGQHVGSALVYLDTVDSTNNEIKRRAASAPDGLTVLADQQTAGRGRRGRSFVSPAGQGLYLSVLLRPHCGLEEIPSLTAWTAVAVCEAIQQVCGITPGIKWPNDIICQGKKLCGILTELELEAESGNLSHVVVGLGINVHQQEADFGPDVAPVAISLAQLMPTPPRRAELAAAVLAALEQLYRAFPAAHGDYLARYRHYCLTVGQPVRVLLPDGTRTGLAEAVDEHFGLTIRWDGGSRETLTSGEVSVRGLLGYV